MIISPPLYVTTTTPSTNLTMFDRFGIGATGFRTCHGALETCSHIPIIGGVISNSVSLRGKACPRNHDVGGERHRSLRFRQQVRIKRYLKDCIPLRFASKLCVDYLVRPQPKRLGVSDASKTSALPFHLPARSAP